MFCQLSGRVLQQAISINVGCIKTGKLGIAEYRGRFMRIFISKIIDADHEEKQMRPLFDKSIIDQKEVLELCQVFLAKKLAYRAGENIFIDVVAAKKHMQNILSGKSANTRAVPLFIKKFDEGLVAKDKQILVGVNKYGIPFEFIFVDKTKDLKKSIGELFIQRLTAAEKKDRETNLAKAEYLDVLVEKAFIPGDKVSMEIIKEYLNNDDLTKEQITERKAKLELAINHLQTKYSLSKKELKTTIFETLKKLLLVSEDQKTRNIIASAVTFANRVDIEEEIIGKRTIDSLIKLNNIYKTKTLEEYVVFYGKETLVNDSGKKIYEGKELRDACIINTRVINNERNNPSFIFPKEIIELSSKYPNKLIIVVDGQTLSKAYNLSATGKIIKEDGTETKNTGKNVMFNYLEKTLNDSYAQEIVGNVDKKENMPDNQGRDKHEQRAMIIEEFNNRHVQIWREINNTNYKKDMVFTIRGINVLYNFSKLLERKVADKVLLKSLQESIYRSIKKVILDAVNTRINGETLVKINKKTELKLKYLLAEFEGNDLFI